MQQNKKGSILLYVLFLSSFLILFFISFQGELENMMGGTKNSEENIRDISSIQDALILLKNTPTSVKTIESNKNLSFISLSQNNTLINESLNGDKSQEYWITSTGGSTSIALTMTSGGPISYHLAAFNSGSESSSTLISSGVVSTSTSIPLSPSLNTHILTIESLGGQVGYILDPSTSTIIPASTSYKLERDIQGYKVYEGIYDITHFIPKSRINFDYQKMGMYLKE
ncbi:MAG: hypothetical protein PHQ95_01510 [Candidatus Gracilibacteria bacterium]|nr:hypothetical protein [Candidatus Gracilibacteria bacterium]